jgi:hypothetical protein
MFWLPRKTIYKGPKRQRGNIVVELGLPPQYMPDVTGDLGGGWTVDAEYSEAAGDLTSILATMSIRRCDGFAWAPDGSAITISDANDDVIRSYNCSTAWNPNTASLFSSRAVTNGSGVHFNESGSLLISQTVVGDQIVSYPCTNHRILGSGSTKTLTKASVGFSGSADGSWASSFDLDTIFWSGPDGGDAFKRISVPGGDLDNFSVDQTYVNGDINPNAGSSESQVTIDGKLFIRAQGSQGLRFRRMTTANDLSTVLNWLDAQAVNGLAVLDHRPSRIWFNPKDTSYVWTSDVGGSNLEFVRFKTNTPEQ